MTEPSPQVNWKSVGLFYVLACAVSWPSFWWRDIHTASWIAWRVPGFLKMAPIMWGPGIAALVVLAVFRRSHPKTITFVGGAVGRSLAFYLVPFGLLAVVGLPGAQQPVIAVTLHGWIDALGEAPGLLGISPARVYAVFGVSLVFWGWMLWTWRRAPTRHIP